MFSEVWLRSHGFPASRIWFFNNSLKVFFQMSYLFGCMENFIRKSAVRVPGLLSCVPKFVKWSASHFSSLDKVWSPLPCWTSNVLDLKRFLERQLPQRASVAEDTCRGKPFSGQSRLGLLTQIASTIISTLICGWPQKPQLNTWVSVLYEYFLWLDRK